MSPVRGPGGRGGDVRHVAPGLGLRDGNARSLATGQEVGQESLLERTTAKLDDGRDPKGEPGVQRRPWTGGSGASELQGQLSFSLLSSRRSQCTYLVTVDARVQIIPVLDLDGENLVDPKPLEPVDRERSGEIGDQHVVFAKGVKDMIGHGALFLPFDRILEKVLPEELAAGFLELAVAVGVVGRGETAQVRGLGEGNRVGRDGGHEEGSIWP